MLSYQCMHLTLELLMPFTCGTRAAQKILKKYIQTSIRLLLGKSLYSHSRCGWRVNQNFMCTRITPVPTRLEILSVTFRYTDQCKTVIALKPTFDNDCFKARSNSENTFSFPTTYTIHKDSNPLPSE